MIDYVASLASLPEQTISTIMKSEEYSLFLKSINQGRVNEHQFHVLVTFITRQVQKETQLSVIYVAAGQYPLFTGRNQADKENQPTSLKIDFFTAKIKWSEETKAVHSDCFDGASRLLSKRLHEVLTNTSEADLANNAQKDFAMEDIRTLLELKSKTAAINESKWLENLTLKATELLRYQFHRRFILGFLVAGNKIRVILFSREGIFMGAPACFMETTLLVRCIAATVSASDIELGLPPEGFFTYSSDQKFSIALKSVHSGQKLFFDNLQQTQRPSPDILIGRGTSVHKVKERNSGKIFALKMSSPYSIRAHEGSILTKLQNLSDVAHVEAFAEWPRDGLQTILHTVAWDRPSDLHHRSFRLTVTEWIEDRIATTKIDLIETLDAWRKVYKAVANLAKAGYLHRDLSFNNVRLKRTSNDEIVVKLIDFDLVDQIGNLDSAVTAPDRTGTFLFMPIEILETTNPPPRQEQHEDETAFWVGLLSLFKHYFRGHHVARLWSEESWALSQIKAIFIKDLYFFGNSRLFNEPVPEFRDYVPFLIKLCISLIKEQFKDVLPNFEYPRLEIRSEGQRQQAINHQRINQRICQILENAVTVLRATSSIPDLADTFKEMCL